MTTKPPSIGEAPTISLVRRQESYPLPKARREVVVAFERILNLGGVQKVSIELGSPIKVVRLVEPNSVSPEDLPEEILDDDLVNASRNAAMEEFIFKEDLSPTVYLLHAFHLLSNRQMKAKAMVVNNLKIFRRWLQVGPDFDLSEVFGVEVKAHKEIPDETLLLVATRIDEEDVVSLSLRLELNLED